MRELTIEASPENLNDVTNIVCEELEAVRCPPKLQMQISLAVEEIFINIACYAYSPATGNAVIRISIDDAVVIRFEDTGKPYNPLETPSPDITLPADEREIGGLGVFMVKHLMDEVAYSYENGKNILTVTKKIP